MNLDKVKEHPIMDLISKLEMYVQEPGDPIWDKVRGQLEMEIKLNEHILNATIWKAMIFNSLHKAFEKSPEVFEKRPEFIVKTLTAAFYHLDEIYEQN